MGCLWNIWTCMMLFVFLGLCSAHPLGFIALFLYLSLLTRVDHGDRERYFKCPVCGEVCRESDLRCPVCGTRLR